MSLLRKVKKRRVTTKNAAYSAIAMDIVLVDAVGAAVTITLPAVHSINDIIDVKKIDVSMNVVTVAGNGNTIDGFASINLMSLFESLSVASDGTNWHSI